MSTEILSEKVKLERNSYNIMILNENCLLEVLKVITCMYFQTKLKNKWKLL